MKFFLCFYISILVFSAQLYAQDTNTNTSAVAISIGAKSYTTPQIQALYLRAKQNDTVAYQSVNDFVQAFVKKQLIVSLAEREGRHQTVAFKEETSTLKSQLTDYFLEDTVALNALLRESYQRMGQELNISHILVAVAPFAAATDTLEAYNSIMALRNRVFNGERFEELAKVHSADKATAINGGSLGYISAFQTVYDFETAAYLTENGQISQPFRTQYGYHIVKIVAKRPYMRWRTAHIFVAAPKTANAELQSQAKKKIEELYSQLKTGKDFAALAKAFSEDGTTASRGGEFRRMFGSDELEKTFEEALFALKTNGSYSVPTLTSRGWHIIKLLEKQELKTYQQMLPFLKNKIKGDGRYQKVQASLIEKTKAKNNFLEISAVKTRSLQMVDSLLAKNAKIENEIQGLKTIFQIGNRATRASQFFDFVQKEKSSFKPSEYSVFLTKKWYCDFLAQQVMRFAQDNLDADNVEFKAQVDEYKEEVLYHAVAEDRIWNVAVEDTLKQREYYNINKNTFKEIAKAQVEILEAQTSADLRAAQAAFEKQPIILSLKWRNLLFKKNISTLNHDQESHLVDLAALLQKNPDYQITILGHIDPEETDSVAINRAYSVEKFLTDRGVKASRIGLKDNNKFKPLSKTNRSLNSRVEFEISSANKQDYIKLYNSLRGNALKLTTGLMDPSNHEVLKDIKWEEGKQQLSKNGKQFVVHLSQIQPAGILPLENARGRVIKGLQAQLEKNLLEKLKSEFTVYINENEIRKIK
jgi:peptidyl-prolyl cis-trans isomerase SurA